MSPLTLADIERELTELADDLDDGLDGYEWAGPDKLRSLARRIAVQVEMSNLSEAA